MDTSFIQKPRARSPQKLQLLLDEIRGCRHCAEFLPHEPRPVLRVDSGARIVLIGQAPGSKVHASGLPWDDASGEHLRSWLNIGKDTFYDANRLAIMPMGLCWPGRRKGGDLPPRRECAPLWHEQVLEQLPRHELYLLVGSYAIERYLGAKKRSTLTESVRAFREYLPRYFPLPHPSWRSKIWIRDNPWFESDVIPVLRQRVQECLEE